jgi:hypothetical protein
LGWDSTRKDRGREVELGEAWEIPNGCRNLRIIEVITGKVQPLKVNKTEEGAVGVDRAVETTATKIKPNHMTRLFVTLDSIPCAAAGVVSSLSWFPRRNFWISTG